MQWEIFSLFLVAGICLAAVPRVPEFDVNKLDTIQKLKEKCEKITPNSYEKLKSAIVESKSCLEGEINPEKMMRELNEAKKTGSMDEVFASYCKKRSVYDDCAMKAINASKACMEQKEKDSVDNIIKLINDIEDFMCYQDGDRLAMFVAEGGIECISSRGPSIMNCINSTLKIPSEGLNITNLGNQVPTLEITKERCDDFAQIRHCVVTDLESNCQDTTPANVVDALFKFIDKSTCKRFRQKRHFLGLSIKRAKRDIGIYANNMIDFATINGRIEEKCVENGGSNATNDFWASFNTAKTCFGNKHIFNTPKSEYLNSLKSCTKDWIRKVEACLPEQSQFYPTFVIDALEALTEFAYDHFNIRTLSPKSDIVFCLQRIKTVGFKKNFNSCVDFMKSEEKTKVSIPDKKELCKIWLSVDNCINNFVKTTCTPDIAVDQFLGNLTLAVEKPCRNELAAEN